MAPGPRRPAPAKSSRRTLRLDAIQEEFTERARRADAAIDSRLDDLVDAGRRNAALIFGKSPI